MVTAQDDTSDSVWQGYVSVVACLLMSLLLLLGVIVLCVTILGRFAKDTAPLADAAEVPSTLQAPAPPPPPPPPRVVAAQRPLVSPIKADWILVFPDSTVAIAPSVESQITRRLFAGHPPSDRSKGWRLRAAADANSTSARRTAYLRLYAVRDYLVGQGVHPSDIDMRIVTPSADNRTPYAIPVLVTRTAGVAASGGNRVRP